MKKTLFTLMLAFVAIVGQAKDVKTVVFTTNPQMHCENCENKIKGNLKFESGVKEITTNVEKQTVTVKYDADKTSESKLTAAFNKIGYEATKVNAANGCCKEGQQTCQKKDGEKACCKQNGTTAGEKVCCKKMAKSGEKALVKGNATKAVSKNKKAVKAKKATTKTDANTSASATR